MGTPDSWLECCCCGMQFDFGPLFAGCPVCLGSGRKARLDIRYDYKRRERFAPDEKTPGLWRWRAMLPPTSTHDIVSLGEGNTPLLKLNQWPGASSLYLKNETVNPTYSWKDRANTVSVSVARRFGCGAVVASSTGNHGVSAAAYAAAGALQCTVFCHEDVPPMQAALMRLFGAEVCLGGDREGLLRCMVARGGCFPASVSCPRSGCANPYGVEGFKTIAFEIFHQLSQQVPDRVFVPVGSGDGLYGVWKGFRELQRLGVAERTPRIVACQAAGANPYVRAFRQKLRRLAAVESVETIALSIAEKIGGDHALQALYECGGEAVSAEDDEIIEAARWVAQQGLALEPASAAAIACANKLADQGHGETWVAIASGAAVKWPEALCGYYAVASQQRASSRHEEPET